MTCPMCGERRCARIGGTALDIAYLEREEPCARPQKKPLSENDGLGAAPRRRYHGEGILFVNLVSSLGSGKTALPERTLVPRDATAVLSGDLQTDNHVWRLSHYGLPVRQIGTSGTCHLDAKLVEGHLNDLGFRGRGILFLENVGNLGCPSSYDLGEAAKIVLLSGTEGVDKPLKYPGIFRRSALLILTNTNLLPYVVFSAELAFENAGMIHREIYSIALSPRTGAGFAEWLNWLACLPQKVQHESFASIT
jgi:hydrogenase nickel incorporation protein HypB